MKEEPTLLIVDDDRANLDSYALGFVRQPYRLLIAQGGAQALEILRSEPVDVVLTDLKMPDVDGLEVVRAAAAQSAAPPTIVLTAYGTIETAVEAMRLGAFDYITKPVNLRELRAKIEKAIEFHSLRVQNNRLQGLLHDRFKFEGVVGVSQAMREVIEQSRRVAQSRASVLIFGESGTGKELIARAIHFNSPRSSSPFVPIHCGAIPEGLMEAELFGSEKGAYTGATQRRIGHFESANSGTVFLDELGEIPPATQVKLLRVLEQREITRVGATRPISIDIRLVAATNKRLEEEVRAGRFREDLFYRLNVVRIELPPLRERPEDIAPLTAHFLKTLAKENDRPVPEIAPEALDALFRFPWRGNIRELRNAIEQMIIFASSHTIGVENLPAAIRAGMPNGAGTIASVSLAPQAEKSSSDGLRPEETPTLSDLEKTYILSTLEQMNGNRTHAARRLGISRRTLQRKLKELGLEDKSAS